MVSNASGRRVEAPTGASSFGRWAGLLSVAGAVVFWVVTLTLGYLWDWYSPIHNFVSTLSAVGAPYAFAAQLNLYFWGASVVALAWGLHRWSARGRRPWVGVLLLMVVGVGIALAGLFQYNPENVTGMSTTGHRIATRVMMIATLLGFPLTTWRLAGEERWTSYRQRLVPVGVAVVLIASFAISMVSIPTGPTGWAGLGQRVFFAAVTGWLAYHGLALYRLSRSEASDL